MTLLLRIQIAKNYILGKPCSMVTIEFSRQQVLYKSHLIRDVKFQNAIVKNPESAQEADALENVDGSSPGFRIFPHNTFNDESS